VITLPVNLSDRLSRFFTGRLPAKTQALSADCFALALILAASACFAQSTSPAPQSSPGSTSQSPPVTNTTQPLPLPSSPGNQPPAAPAPPQLPIVIPAPLKPALSSLISGEACLVRNTGATMAVTAAMRGLAVSGLNAVPAGAGSSAVISTRCIPHLPLIDWYARFLNGPEVKPMTPQEKAWLAVHNLLDPFNLLTIGGEAAISVAANSHSPYGPGFPGWGRYTGVSFTQDMTGEFFGTFLIPSLTHQDPHYHREPNATTRHRIAHAAIQVLWTQGDNGKGMINYADIVGFAADDAVGNLYVPGQQTRITASAARYGIALATAPIDNYVTEFLPDLARHIHIQVVVIQRVINQVARTDNSAP
jgi:hypothetical protein